jgi:hypothetical protein
MSRAVPSKKVRIKSALGWLNGNETVGGKPKYLWTQDAKNCWQMSRSNAEHLLPPVVAQHLVRCRLGRHAVGSRCKLNHQGEKRIYHAVLLDVVSVLIAAALRHCNRNRLNTRKCWKSSERRSAPESEQSAYLPRLSRNLVDRVYLLFSPSRPSEIPTTTSDPDQPTIRGEPVAMRVPLARTSWP